MKLSNSNFSFNNNYKKIFSYTSKLNNNNNNKKIIRKNNNNNRKFIENFSEENLKIFISNQLNFRNYFNFAKNILRESFDSHA